MTARHLVRLLLLGGLLWPGVTLADAGTAGVWLERLRADHAALTAAEADFHARRERGDLAGREATDYAAYVAGLHRRVAEDCAVLLEQGIAIPSAIECPETTATQLAPADIDQVSERTGAEATAALDAELLAGLGEFDEMLLQEQARVRAATPRTDSVSAGAGGGGGADGGHTNGGEGDATTAAASGTEAREPTDGAGAGPGAQRPPRASSAPPGTPDGSDDDVVARQLREAAEKETDPELKKKLWEEYRKYKTGTQ